MGVATERTTYCRICEAYCGLVASVGPDGRLERLRPDREHPLSRGYACPKGIAMAEVQNDPDRVLHPLRRRPDGTFERVSWDAAMADIGARARGVAAAHGRDAIGWYMGNPGAFSYSHALWVKGLLDALGSPHYYTAGSQDVNNRFAASALLYGSPLLVPVPDIPRTDLLLMVGANPLVSHGSLVTTPRIREALHEIPARGGRVVVVDPRRTETAARLRAPSRSARTRTRSCSSACCTCSSTRRSRTAGRSRRLTTGAEDLERWAAGFPPERTADRTGVPAAPCGAWPGGPRDRRRRRGLRPHGLLPRPPRDARRLPAGRAERGRPATSTAPAARCSGRPRSRSTRSPSASASRPTRSGARASAASPTSSATCPPR